jgi:hypothetical protein
MIPKIIWQTYKTKKDDVPPYARRAMRTWTDRNPGWSHRYRSQPEVLDFIRESFGPEWLEIVLTKCPVGVMTADIWRLMILYRFGGVYADLDTECLVPIDSWLDGLADFDLILNAENAQDIVYWTIAAAPEHPAIGHALQVIKRGFENPDYDNPHFVHALTGPSVFTNGVLEYLELDENRVRDGVRGGRLNLHRDVATFNASPKAVASRTHLVPSPAFFHSEVVQHMYGSLSWTDGKYVSWTKQRDGMKQLPECRHRGDPVGETTFRCKSPKLVGLDLVTKEVCGECPYRDHEPDPEPERGRLRLLPCLHLGPAQPSPPRNGNNGSHHANNHLSFRCAHPSHRTTTEEECRRCDDYCFPIVTPRTPSTVVSRMLEQPMPTQPRGWWSWPNVQEGLRLASARAIENCPPYPSGLQGRGIVVAGGGRYFASAYVTIRLLRRFGCELPIQLWHFAGEITPGMRDALAPYAVECVDADRMVERRPFPFLAGHWWKGWQLKCYAVVHAPFREVLFLDADCCPVRNPEPMFDWAPYRERGAVFWPDVPSSAGLLPADRWRIFGAAPGWSPIEAGQLLVNKKKCWKELSLALWYNARAPLVYNLVWGDKDTFNIAWRRLGTYYAMTQPTCGWDVHTILQYGPDGEVLFQHRCQDKFRIGPEKFDTTGQCSPQNQYNSRLAHEDLCFEMLDELRRSAAGPWGDALGGS